MQRQTIFKSLAQHYDLLYSWKDYRQEVETIRELIRTHKKSPGTDILEDGDGYIVSGNFDLVRVEQLFELRHEEDIDSTTIGGLISEWLGRVPKAGEVVERNGLRIEVLAGDDLRVSQVRISKIQPVAHD